MDSLNTYALVVVGDMNASIHSPEWYFQEKIINEEDFNVAKKDPSMAVTQPAAQFITSKYRILCLANRWEISTQRKDVDIFSVAKTVFKLLSHTPISAFGFNFHFERALAEHEIAGSLGGMIGNLPLGLKVAPEDLISGSLKLTWKKKVGQYTLAISPSGNIKNGLHFHLNGNYNIQEIKGFPSVGTYIFDFNEIFVGYEEDLTFAEAQLDNTLAALINRGDK